MAYNYMDSVSNILNLKGEWDAGDEEAKKRAHERAQREYDRLISSGRGDVAEKLRASSYDQAQRYYNRLKTAGMTPVRDRAAGIMTGKYGLTADEANSLIQWNPDTGDVSLGGVVNIGKGDAMADGKNYVSDPSRVDRGVEEWAKTTGRYPSAAAQYNEFTSQANDKTNQLWNFQTADREKANSMMDDYMSFVKTPYYSTREGKSIIDRYAGLGDGAAYGAIAAGAGSNGGNIDSYAAAQAARQQKSFLNEGNEQARQWYAARANQLLGGYNAFGADNSQRYGDMLNTIGMQDDRANYVFANNEDALSNENDRKVKRWETEAKITGEVPSELATENNPYLLADGSFDPRYENVDFMAEIQRRLAAGENENSTAINWLKEARNAKMSYKPDSYGQYWGQGYTSLSPRQTEEGRQFDQDSSDTRYGIDVDAATQKHISDNALDATRLQTEADKYGYDKEYEKARTQAEAELEGMKFESEMEHDAVLESLTTQKFVAMLQAGINDADVPFDGATFDGLKAYMGKDELDTKDIQTYINSITGAGYVAYDQDSDELYVKDKENYETVKEAINADKNLSEEDKRALIRHLGL